MKISCLLGPRCSPPIHIASSRLFCVARLCLRLMHDLYTCTLELKPTIALGRLAMEDEGEPEGELGSLNMETGLGMK